MKSVIIISIAFVLLFPITAFGAVDGYFEETYPKAFSHSPTVCLIQPNDPRITEQTWNNWYSNMKPAIDTWGSILQSSGSGNWEITTVNVPLEKLELLNYSKCDVKVNFIEKPNESYKNYFGQAFIGRGLIEIVYLGSYVCGNQYNSELDLTVATFCPTNNTIRSKQMANTLQHEFGHIIGLGHYRGYDRSTTQEWYDGEKNSPSIMAWIEPNEEMRTVSQIDASKVREVYGAKGFGKNPDSLVPLFNDPIIPETVIPVAGSSNIHITGNPINKMISGYVPDKLYKRGTFLEILIQKPNGFTETTGVSVSKTLHSYKHSLTFDQNSQTGNYMISLKMNGEIFKKIPINVSIDLSTKQSEKDKERLEVHNQNVVILENRAKEKEQIQQDKQEKQLKKEVQTLQSKSYHQLDSLKKGNDDAEKSLKSITTNTPEQKQEIDKAWDLLKINKQKLTDITERYQKGDKQLGYEYYGNSKSWYTSNTQDNQLVGDNLKVVSKIIENTTTQTCFLFFCW